MQDLATVELATLSKTLVHIASFTLHRFCLVVEVFLRALVFRNPNSPPLLLGVGLILHKGKGKGKAEDRIQKPKPDAKPKPGASPSDKCFQCGDSGHWSRNYQKYLEEKKKQKGSEASASGINVIEINLATSSSESWVFDTGLMIHTCKSLQGLKQTRSFARDELDVCVSNRAKVAVLAVGTYHLSLPSGLVMELTIVILFQH